MTTIAGESTEKIVIPYGNPAGRAAFDILYKIAKRIHAEATAATSKYVIQHFPGSETVRTDHDQVEHKFHRIIRMPSGKERTLVYDYKEKTIEVV